MKTSHITQEALEGLTRWPPEKEPFIQTPRFYSFKAAYNPKDSPQGAGHTTHLTEQALGSWSWSPHVTMVRRKHLGWFLTSGGPYVGTSANWDPQHSYIWAVLVQVPLLKISHCFTPDSSLKGPDRRLKRHVLEAFRESCRPLCCKHFPICSPPEHSPGDARDGPSFRTLAVHWDKGHHHQTILAQSQ